ncbi:MAG: hypothetical protein RL189_1918 [Pseudomonadota bacterium]
MNQRAQTFLHRVAGSIGTGWQGLCALPFLLPVLMSAQTRAQTPAQTPGQNASEQVTCRSVPLNTSVKNASSESHAELAKVLEEFERAFFRADAELFSSLVSPALLKKKEEAVKIFEGTLLEFDLRRAKLQRNWMWELNLGTSAEPGRLVQCGDTGIQPVYGPLHQFAVQYSAFTGSHQTKLLALFAKTPVGQSGGKNPPGLVHLQVQRWTYDGRTPDRLMNDARKSASRGEIVIGTLLAEASARVMEINPYVIPPQLRTARDLAAQLGQDFDSLQSKFLAGGKTIVDWKPEKLVPVFRDGSLAVGLKVRMQREFALNDQTSRCHELGKSLFIKESAWREYFSGVECMPYPSADDLNQPPRGGSQFFPWSKLDSKSH